MLVLGLSALAGCVAKPIVLDRQAGAAIKRVGLPTIGLPSSPTVRVVNAVGDRLGVVGLLAGAAVRSNRRGALTQILASHGFDPRAALSAALTRQLAAHGITAVPFEADANRTAFLPAVPESPTYTAVLDLYVSDYGFIALSDADVEPYRATVSVPVRLVGVPGREVLMQDTVFISSAEATPVAGAAAAPRATFATFTEIEADPAAATAALAAAFDDAAAGIVRRLT